VFQLATFFKGRCHLHAELVDDELGMVDEDGVHDGALNGIIAGYYWPACVRRYTLST